MRKTFQAKETVEPRYKGIRSIKYQESGGAEVQDGKAPGDLAGTGSLISMIIFSNGSSHLSNS